MLLFDVIDSEKKGKPFRENWSHKDMPSKYFCSCSGFLDLLLENTPGRLNLYTLGRLPEEDMSLIQGQHASKSCQGYVDNMDGTYFKWRFSEITVNKQKA